MAAKPRVNAAHTLVLAEDAQLAIAVHVAARAVEVEVLAQAGSGGGFFFQAIGVETQPEPAVEIVVMLLGTGGILHYVMAENLGQIPTGLLRAVSIIFCTFVLLTFQRRSHGKAYDMMHNTVTVGKIVGKVR